MIQNFVSQIKSASSYVGNKFRGKPTNMTKLASKRDDGKSKELFWGVIIAISIGLGGWALKTTVDLQSDMREERALRAATDAVVSRRLDEMKSDTEKAINDARGDSEKRLQEYKNDAEYRIREVRVEADRRYTEIQRQLELLNNKLDKLLTKPTP